MKKQIIFMLRMTFILVVVTALAVILYRFGIKKENAVLLFIVGVLLTTCVTEGYQYGVISSILSGVIFNFLFTVPYGTLTLSDENDVVLLLFFLCSALIVANLAVRLQKQVRITKENEQKAARLQREKERIRFEVEKERVRSSFLRSISHDLRTPLTGIAGASSLIMDDFDKLEKKDIMQLAGDIVEQTDWLIQMVENILNMTKIESGNLKLDKQAEAVEDVINNALKKIRKRLAERSVTIKIPENVILVEIDGSLIIQVLINLLENAIKNTKDNGNICIRVEETQDKVWFLCEDDGNGISATVLSSVFEEFVTDKSVVQDSVKGIGLGLAICRAIVSAHGGEVAAGNREEGGACVKFSVPYRKDGGYGEDSFDIDCGG